MRPLGLDDDGGCLDDGRGQDAGFEVEFLDSLTTHQRHQAVPTRGDLDLRHHPVDDHPRDDAVELVPRRERAHLGTGLLRGKRSEMLTVDHLPTRLILACLEPSRGNPSAHRVVTHPKELSDLSDPEMRHVRTVVDAIAACVRLLLTQIRSAASLRLRQGNVSQLAAEEDDDSSAMRDSGVTEEATRYDDPGDSFFNVIVTLAYSAGPSLLSVPLGSTDRINR